MIKFRISHVLHCFCNIPNLCIMKYQRLFSKGICRTINSDFILFLGVYISYISPNDLYLSWNWVDRWLSGSALKQVATFGCSHTSSKAVFPAKRLRKFFEVPENTVRFMACMKRHSM